MEIRKEAPLKKTKNIRDTTLVRHGIYTSQKQEETQIETESPHHPKRKLDPIGPVESDLFDIDKHTDILSETTQEMADIRPMENWMSLYFNPQGMTAKDLQNAALQEMNNTIIKGNEILHQKQKNENNPSNTIPEKTSSFRKPKKRKTYEASSLSKETESTKHSSTRLQIDKNEDMIAFYQNDNDEQPYELDPTDYVMYQLVLEFEKKKETVLNILFRDKAREWYKQANQPLNQNVIEQQPDLYTYEDLEGVTKRYCMHFLQSPSNSKERACVNGRLCIGNILVTLYPHTSEHSLDTEGVPCILKEFLLPKELEAFKKSGVLPSYRKPCLLCNRFTTTTQYLQNLEKHHNSIDIIQDHYVIIDEDDGYKKDDCLLPIIGGQFCGIVAPFYPFLPNSYIVEKKKVTNSGSQKSYHYIITEREVGFPNALTQIQQIISFQ